MALDLKKIKALAKYKTECSSCRFCNTAAKDIPACITEIGRLKRLVESAYREGLECGNTWCGSREIGEKNTDRLLWEDSKARKALEDK